MKKLLIVFGIIVIIAVGAIVAVYPELRRRVQSQEKPVATATFACDGGKTIQAAFYHRRVDLVLSDGRSLTVPQTISADGARYANADESFIFWNVGDTATITEHDVVIYAHCIVSAPDLR